MVSGGRVAAVVGLVVWAAVIAVPLAWLYGTVGLKDIPAAQDLPAGRYLILLIRSCGLAAMVATASVLLGWPAASLIGRSDRARRSAPLLLAVPLLIPPQVVYYAWDLLLLPTSSIGSWLSQAPDMVAWVVRLRSAMSLGVWHWPVCALLIGATWRRTDPDIWDQGRLESGSLRRWWSVGLPMLAGGIVTAWVVTFALALVEFAVSHLTANSTIGTELATLYHLSGSVHAVAWASLPTVVPAVLAAVLIDRLIVAGGQTFGGRGAGDAGRLSWVAAGVVWMVGTVVPVVLLIAHVRGWQGFVQLGRLSFDALAFSVVVALGAGMLAIVVALATFSAGRYGWRRLAWTMRVTTFVAALMPGSLVAAALVGTYNRGWLADVVYSHWWMVSFGHAARLAGLAVLVTEWVRATLPAGVRELAEIDGARGWRAAQAWLAGLWPALGAAGLLAMTLSIAELPATMILLPPDVPNFAQRLMNQMHYARDQHVIASCLVWIAFGVVAAILVFVCVRAQSRLGGTQLGAFVLLTTVTLTLVGCGPNTTAQDSPVVLGCVGCTGRADGQFVYPRAIGLAPDGTYYVVDKTARVQRFNADGEPLGGWQMPQWEKGKPVGLSCGPDGTVYVADTHYHRIMMYTPTGDLVGELGSYGTGDGQFIYPTDVAAAPDGRLFVSEYGGNDRISVFSADGQFLGSFGSWGSGDDEFSRPAALCIDAVRGVLFVADACNHRVVRYDLEGRRLGTVGVVGSGVGQLRYPYDVNVLDDGSVVVCEYGNNRIQVFSPDGRSLRILGRAGRGLGELSYPWGAVVDGHGRLLVVDSGNDRIQTWRW